MKCLILVLLFSLGCAASDDCVQDQMDVALEINGDLTDQEYSEILDWCEKKEQDNVERD